MPDELRLVPDKWRVLRAATAEEDEAERHERDAAAAAVRKRQVDVDVERVVAALRDKGQQTSVDAVVALAGMKVTPGRVAVGMGIAAGKIIKGGTKKQPTYAVASPNVGGGRGEHDALSDTSRLASPKVGGERPPIPPGRRDGDVLEGRPPLASPGVASQEAEGTSRDVGTSMLPGATP